MTLGTLFRTIVIFKFRGCIVLTFEMYISLGWHKTSPRVDSIAGIMSNGQFVIDSNVLRTDAHGP
jgi:hypothetical protein